MEKDNYLTFDEWIFKVCECMSALKRKDITEIYSSINLSEAKLAFLDGEDYATYKPI